VNFVEAGGGVATPALMSGSIQFSTSSGAAISAIIKGAPLRVVLTLSESVPWKLWATKPEIKSLRDLKGQQVGIATRGDLLEVSVRNALAQAGLPQDWVSFTALGTGSALRMSVLKSAALPAVVADNLSAQVLKDAGELGEAHVLVDLGADIKTPYLGLATTAELIASKPDLVRRFLKGSLMGLAYLKAYPEGAFKIMQPRSSKVPPEVLKRNIAEAAGRMIDRGEAGMDSQKGEIAIRRQILGLPEAGAQAPSAVFDYSLVRKVKAELDAQGWHPTE
jgi:ABC-type nitrate/sulfonate/bicarbonate transport system substrate-binding protein